MENNISKNLLSFIKNSPTSFHAVSSIKKILAREGFNELKENDSYVIAKGGKYYVTRNDSSIIAFKVGSNLDNYYFTIVASHSDSPSLKIKQQANINSNGYSRLNVEVYGGMLMSTWLDRPLSIAGRVIINENGTFKANLVDFDKNMVNIPSVAIHFNREANNGYKYNPSTDLVGILGLGDVNLVDLLANKLEIAKENIANYDLFLYNKEDGVFVGQDDEFIMSTRLDDLQCAYTTLMGFVKSSNEHNISVYCCFDNEEVGSLTRQGADSTFFEDTLNRISLSLNKTKEEHLCALNKSFLVSADNAHAIHPNHPEYTDISNGVYINKGVVVKFNASQAYTSDSMSCSLFKEVCRLAEVPVQVFHNKSDIRGGSTLGNISNGHVSLRSVDIGLAQLAMHSIYETAGTLDNEYMVKAITKLYESDFIVEADNLVKIR